MRDYKILLNEVLERIKPSESERRILSNIIRKVMGRAERYLVKHNLDVDVKVEGSVAKDTWLSGDRDLDIFLRFPKSIGKNGLIKFGLEMAKFIAGENYVECYAEHPYIEAEIEGFKVDLVPCFKVDSPSEIASSVDRTPFHTEYVNLRLNGHLKNEVRLLKKFMKGIGVYGAEIKIRGFSGYLCELLTIFYKSFIDVLKGSLKWHPFSTIIDIEGYYAGFEDEALKMFNSPLIVVDPVDRKRNVAAALSLNNMCKFMSAAHIFLKNPSLEFFFPKPVQPLSRSEILEQIHERGSEFMFILTGCPKIHPDILWGQLYKSLEGIENLLRSFDFNIINSTVWSNEKDLVIFILELERLNLPTVKRHIGPPVYNLDDSERFLRKYLYSSKVLSGPSVENDRWVVYVKRKHTSAIKLIRDDIFRARLGELVKSAFQERFEILVNEEIIDIYVKNPFFASFFTSHLHGRPGWLKL